MPRIRTSQILDDVSALVGTVDALRAAALASAAADDDQLLDTLRWERSVQAATYGEDSAEVAALDRETAIVERRQAVLATEAERARLPVPDPVNDAAVVHGRVVNSNRRSVDNLTVRARDADGTVVATDTTASGGTYRLVIADDRPVHLEVARRGKVLAADRRATRLIVGSVTWRELAI